MFKSSCESIIQTLKGNPPKLNSDTVIQNTIATFKMDSLQCILKLCKKNVVVCESEKGSNLTDTTLLKKKKKKTTQTNPFLHGSIFFKGQAKANKNVSVRKWMTSETTRQIIKCLLK